MLTAYVYILRIFVAAEDIGATQRCDIVTYASAKAICQAAALCGWPPFLFINY